MINIQGLGCKRKTNSSHLSLKYYISVQNIVKLYYILIHDVTINIYPLGIYIIT